jgi:hypothetical protein
MMMMGKSMFIKFQEEQIEFSDEYAGYISLTDMPERGYSCSPGIGY